MPVENRVKCFPGAGKKTGVEVWRIEFFKPVAVPQTQYGKFHKGDSYIVLQTIKVGNQANLFLWLGKETSQDEAGAAAALAVQLDDELGGFPVQHRETGGYETKDFKNVFPSISFLEGGHASGFKEGKKKFEKALLQVKGKRKVYASQVPLSVESLNQGDCFVLDCGRKIYVWNGKSSNKRERFNASRYAQELRDEERAGLAKIFHNETPEEEEDFFYELTGHRRVVQITKEGERDETVEQAVNNNLKLYRVREDSTGNITMEETGSKPLKRDDLKSDDAFILETAGCVYVWLGKKASKKEKTTAYNDANGFIQARNLNPKTAIKIIQEDLEPTTFKQYFFPWERVVGFGNTKTYQAGVGITSREKIEQKFGKFEVKSMHDRRKSVTSSLPDDGTGKKEVWRVESFELKPVALSSHGVFFSGDCYVVLYTYVKGTKERHIIYFWLGNDSTSDEQGTAAAAAIQLDDKFNGEPYQVRVCEGKEPEHFFKIFNDRLLIYQGGHASGFKNVKHSSVSSDTRLLQVRVTGNNARIVEVAPVAQSLNSSDVFVLHKQQNPAACFIWVGKYSIGDEKECAKEVLGRMDTSTDHDLVMEGQEPQVFWQMLGGKADYASAKQSWATEENEDIAARLFHCSNASGRFVVEEILDFSQEDLEEDDVMILDAWTQLFVWIGKTARSEEKQEAIKTALEYVKTDPRQRSTGVTMSVIKQGAEPLSFRYHFVAWEPQMWNKKMSYEDQMRAIKQGNDQVDENAWSMTEWDEQLKPQEYSLEVLQKKGEELPEGVNATTKELHLEDAKFEELFQMTKKEWEKVPQWKKDQKKKALDLF